MKDDILSGLNDMQKEAVCHRDGPLLILAGAGSGKTSVLTHRIAMLVSSGVPEYQIMAITFTNKAAKEMKDRVAQILGNEYNSVFVATFHSTCVRILRKHIDKLGYGNDFTIYDTADSVALIKSIVKAMNLDLKNYPAKSILRGITNSKNKLVKSDEELQFTNDAVSDDDMYMIYKAYQEGLKKNNALDFDDLLLKAVDLLSHFDNVRQEYNDRYQYIMVDEYQDTNNAQFELIRLLSLSHKNLCVVGDDDQSIYKFRGANISNILNFEQYFPEAKVIKLEQNYRSTSQILDTANAVVANNRSRKSKRLWTDNVTGCKPQLYIYETDRDEVSFIMNEIETEVSSGKSVYKDYAILYRSNNMSRLFEEKAIMMGIPYKIIGNINFYERAEIKNMLAYLRVLVNPNDDISLQRIINVPKRGIGATSVDKLIVYANMNSLSLYEALLDIDKIDAVKGKTANSIKSFVDMIEKYRSKYREQSINALIGDIFENTGYREELKKDASDSIDRLENISELISKAATYELDSENPTLENFLEDVALVSSVDNMTDDDYVVMMTLHGSKGLEFNNVYLVGMEEGVFPSLYAVLGLDNSEIEEERRLCYVGITRAKKVLKLSCASGRMLNGEFRSNRISRFISEIPSEMLEFKGPVNNSNYVCEPDVISKDISKISFEKRFDTTPQYIRKKSTEVKSVKSFLSENKAKMNNIEKIKPEYVVSDRVSHIKYGEGVVKNIVDAGRDYQVSVEFDSGETRILLAGFAKLKKL